MAAASKGAAGAGGTVIGMLPGDGRDDANEWVTVAIPTGIGELRNGLIVRTADAMVAVGGAYGTLSEIALGLQAGLKVYGLHTWRSQESSRGHAEEAVERALAAHAGSDPGVQDARACSDSTRRAASRARVDPIRLP